MTAVGEVNCCANLHLHPCCRQSDPRTAIFVLRGKIWRRQRLIDEAAAGDAGLIGEEAEALPVKCRAAACAEEAVISGVAVLRVDAHLARFRGHSVVGKVGRPAECAAGALAAARAVAEAVQCVLAFDRNRAIAATSARRPRHGFGSANMRSANARNGSGKRSRTSAHTARKPGARALSFIWLQIESYCARLSICSRY